MRMDSRLDLVNIEAEALDTEARKGSIPGAHVRILFLAEVYKHEDISSYETLDLLADLGGYLSLTLGFSLFHILKLTGSIPRVFKNLKKLLVHCTRKK